MLLKLFEDDCKNWQTQYNKSLSLLKSYKLDALLTSAFVCYAGIFDLDTRTLVCNRWISCLTRLNKENKSLPVNQNHHHHNHHNHRSTKFELKTPIQEEADSHTNLIFLDQYILRDDYDFKSIVINQHDHKDTVIQLNRLAQKDKHFINNALLLREFCVLPSLMNWPIVFDPENKLIKVQTRYFALIL